MSLDLGVIFVLRIQLRCVCVFFVKMSVMFCLAANTFHDVAQTPKWEEEKNQSLERIRPFGRLFPHGA